MRVEDGGLRDLSSVVNVCSLQNINVGRPEEQTRLDDNSIYPPTERNLDLKYL